MQAPTPEQYAQQFDDNMKTYITEKIRLGKTLDNLDDKYKRKYAKFIEETKRKYSK